jgi:hypothetical protein
MRDIATLADPREDAFCVRYLVTCAALGVRPVSAEKSRKLIGEWTRAIAGAALH